MDATQIAELLRAELPEDVGELVTDNPDPYVVVAAPALLKACRFLRNAPEIELDFLQAVTAVELEDKMLVVYHLFSYRHRHSFVVRVETTLDEPAVPSVAELWPAANWHEREQYDLFGVIFDGHPDLRRIMMPEDWDGHPLRKGYQAPSGYHGISHERPSLPLQLKALDEQRAKAKNEQQSAPPAATPAGAASDT